ncbi:MAG: hypothetical protein RL115_224 [Bacteroidota bacterium]|jgi:uncharacterized damage-inducible protein DinB
MGNVQSRKSFLQKTTALAAGLTGIGIMPLLAKEKTLSTEDGLFVIGPIEGYSPHIGALVTMLNYNRYTVLNAVKNLTIAELDHLHDSKSNSIGALIMHLGAIDKFYQINTFEGRQEFNTEEKKIWEAAMLLGDDGRKKIKENELKYYLELIGEVREKTLSEFKKKDDDWLLAIDPEWSKKRPLNTYWKWFHVCEHEANHRGQITWLKSRLPGAKISND